MHYKIEPTKTWKSIESFACALVGTVLSCAAIKNSCEFGVCCSFLPIIDRNHLPDEHKNQLNRHKETNIEWKKKKMCLNSNTISLRAKTFCFIVTVNHRRRYTMYSSLIMLTIQGKNWIERCVLYVLWAQKKILKSETISRLLHWMKTATKKSIEREREGETEKNIHRVHSVCCINQ